MARENVMPTPVFDELLREMTSRAEGRAAHGQPQEQRAAPSEPLPQSTARGDHRAE